ncbi:MAG: hydroxyacid dehydrogenase [Opitutaceae bacterium]
MKILVTVPRDDYFDRFFTPGLMERLEAAGDVSWNPLSRQLTAEELARDLAGKEICLTGWHVPRLDRDLLQHADRLRLVAHLGGTVAPVASESLYARGIRVCSGNSVMAKVVAEGVLCYILAGLRNLVRFDRALHEEPGWSRDLGFCRSLIGKNLGFVGLGTVGRHLLELLRPFEVTVGVFDPYIDDEALEAWRFAKRVGLEECLRSSEVVSIHAARTDETRNLLNAERLSLLPDGALLINAARGAIIDEVALVAELNPGRISAVLDVFEEEPLPDDSPLRRMPNLIMTPHLAGSPSHALITEAMISDIERHISGGDLRNEIPVEQFRLMTR